MHRLHAALVFALAWLALARPADASTKIDWSSFDGPLAVDCDLIDVMIEPNIHPSTVVEIALAASNHTTWWKGMQVPDGFGGIHLIEVGGTVKRDAVSLPAHFLKNGQSLHFMKARLLGLHTGVYDLGGLDTIPGGARVTFTWVQDLCPVVQAFMRPGSSSVPTWLMPGERRHVTMTIVNTGQAWYGDARYELASLGPVDWSMQPIPITSTIDSGGVRTFDFDIVAPATAGYYNFDISIRQRGGAAWGPNTRTMPVQLREPAPPRPPAPPKMIRVPAVVGLSAKEAATAIYDAGLNVFVVFDANPFNPNKIILSQSPIEGTLVAEKSQIGLTYQLVDTSPSGFSALELSNCAPGTLELHGFDGDGWHKLADLPSQVGDGGLCPRAGSAPTSHDLTDAELNIYAVVDPSRCTDPTKVVCRVYEWMAWGDAKGEAFPRTVP